MSANLRRPAALAVWVLLASGLTTSTGCALVPKHNLDLCQSKNCELAQQNRSLEAEVENLRASCRQREDQLRQTESELALLEERSGLDRNQLANYRRERGHLHAQVDSLVRGRAGVLPAAHARMVELAAKYPALQFDPETGLGKLDTDILFDSGRADLKSGAEEELATLVRLLRSPEAEDLRVMVVGHTDDRRIVDPAARDAFPTNWHLSANRAVVVVNRLGQLGLEPGRIGQASFGGYQPVAPNAGPSDRQKNRRVEIFVMVPDTPVVGWTETIPSVYRR